MLTILSPIEDQLAALRRPAAPAPPSPEIRSWLDLLRRTPDSAPRRTAAPRVEPKHDASCRWCGRLFVGLRGLRLHLSAHADCAWVHETLGGC